MKKNNIYIVALTLGLFLSMPSVSLALDDIRPPAAPGASGSEAATDTQQTREKALTETRLKVCQKKQNAIQKRSRQLVMTAENMLAKFSRIEERVKTYYSDKAVPAGKTVANYDALVSEITAQKETVRANLDKALASSANFSCNSDNPKGQLSQFRTDMQAVKKSLKEYRTAIKNLIVAVRTASGKAKSSAAANSQAAKESE